MFEYSKVFCVRSGEGMEWVNFNLKRSDEFVPEQQQKTYLLQTHHARMNALGS